MKRHWTMQRVLSLSNDDIAALSMNEKKELLGYTAHKIVVVYDLFFSILCNDALKRTLQQDIEGLRKVKQVLEQG